MPPTVATCWSCHRETDALLTGNGVVNRLALEERAGGFVLYINDRRVNTYFHEAQWYKKGYAGVVVGPTSGKTPLAVRFDYLRVTLLR